MGDSSDNISGVKGIGEKTASQLIKDHHTVEQLYAALENGTLAATKSVSFESVPKMSSASKPSLSTILIPRAVRSSFITGIC